jgi:hypothetical protein
LPDHSQSPVGRLAIKLLRDYSKYICITPSESKLLTELIQITLKTRYLITPPALLQNYKNDLIAHQKEMSK